MNSDYRIEEQDKIEILEEKDVVVCRQACRNWAKRMNFNLIDQTRITTAVSELARNIQEYAGQGEVQIQIVEKDMRRGLRIIFIDHGPGIKNIKLAMSEGWTSHRGMGMGLPGAKRLMDEFALESEAGKGTTVTTCKWLPL